MTVTTPDDDDFTELRDADFDRMDGVGKGANGTQWFIAKSAGDAPGLFPPDFVRDLVAKADAEATSEDVRFTPAQAMALVHAASVRKADGLGDSNSMLIKAAELYPIRDLDELHAAIEFLRS